MKHVFKMDWVLDFGDVPGGFCNELTEVFPHVFVREQRFHIIVNTKRQHKRGERKITVNPSSTPHQSVTIAGDRRRQVIYTPIEYILHKFNLTRDTKSVFYVQILPV